MNVTIVTPIRSRGHMVADYRLRVEALDHAREVARQDGEEGEGEEERVEQARHASGVRR